MSERKHWKAQEKFALINEIKDKGQVVDMQEIRSRSNHVLPLEGILRDLRHGRPQILSGSIEPGLRKLKKENERLKKIIAEKELEVALLQDAYKKRGGEIIDR